MEGVKWEAPHPRAGENRSRTPRLTQRAAVECAHAQICGLGSTPAVGASVPSPLANESPKAQPILLEGSGDRSRHWGGRENIWKLPPAGVWGKLCANVYKAMCKCKLPKISNGYPAYMSCFAIYDIYRWYKREKESLQGISHWILQTGTTASNSRWHNKLRQRSLLSIRRKWKAVTTKVRVWLHRPQWSPVDS